MYVMLLMMRESYLVFDLKVAFFLNDPLVKGKNLGWCLVLVLELRRRIREVIDLLDLKVGFGWRIGRGRELGVGGCVERIVGLFLAIDDGENVN